MAKNIIFDNGGVLSVPKTGHWFITPNFWNILGIEEKENIDNIKKTMKEFIYLLTQEPKTELEEYKMFKDFYYQVLNKINYKNLNENTINSLAWDNVYNDDKYIFFEDVDDELKKLSKEYNLYMITDAWPSSFRVLDNKNISKYFKGIMVSSIESKIKIEGLFERFLEKNKNLIPQESVFIDDRKDILDKAHQCGFKVLLMDRSEKQCDYTYTVINKLNEIEKNLSINK